VRESLYCIALLEIKRRKEKKEEKKEEEEEEEEEEEFVGHCGPQPNTATATQIATHTHNTQLSKTKKAITDSLVSAALMSAQMHIEYAVYACVPPIGYRKGHLRAKGQYMFLGCACK
jgi:hypothetical protein